MLSARWSIALALGGALGACAPPPPPVIAQLPPFSFTAQSGATVTLAGLAGHPWVADFIFTRCIAYCPRLTARMKELRRELPSEVKSVSFTVDPDHDTPAVLAQYAREWHADGEVWLFLTGPRERMWTLVQKGFLLPVEAQPQVTASPILHSNRFVLVDGRGRVRGTYEAFDADALDRLRRDLRGIEAERPS